MSAIKITNIQSRPEDPKGIDYDMSAQDSQYLMGATLLPAGIRKAVLARYLEEHGSDRLVEMFSQFIGLANSAVANNREMIEMYLITECDHYPDTAVKINLPTIFGALNGVGLSDGVDVSKVCSTCAYRQGSVANQSPITTCDAEHCVDEQHDHFMCHHDRDADDNPTKACAGYAQKRASLNGGLLT